VKALRQRCPELERDTNEAANLVDSDQYSIKERTRAGVREAIFPGALDAP
jgi:hypothetical protein